MWSDRDTREAMAEWSIKVILIYKDWREFRCFHLGWMYSAL